MWSVFGKHTHRATCWELTKLEETIKDWTVLSNIDCKKEKTSFYTPEQKEKPRINEKKTAHSHLCICLLYSDMLSGRMDLRNLM